MSLWQRAKNLWRLSSMTNVMLISDEKHKNGLVWPKSLQDSLIKKQMATVLEDKQSIVDFPEHNA